MQSARIGSPLGPSLADSGFCCSLAKNRAWETRSRSRFAKIEQRPDSAWLAEKFQKIGFVHLHSENRDLSLECAGTILN
jgi:hypothetical protein